MFNEDDDEEISETWDWSNASSIQNESSQSSFYRAGFIQFMQKFNTLSILTKGTIGTGIFAMPYAFSRVGLFLGIALFIGMALLITKSLRLLFKIHRLTCTRVEKSMLMYDEIVEITLRNTYTRSPRLFLEFSTYFTNTLLVVYYIGVASVCVDFISHIVRKIMKFDDVNNTARYILIFFPMFMMLNLQKDLRDMVLKSIAGNILILIVTIVGSMYAFENDASTGQDTWIVLNDDVFAYPRFIGIVVYSLSSPGLVLATRHYSTNFVNVQFDAVLNQVMTIVSCSHLFVGIVGYLKWGSNASYNFISNIEQDTNEYTLPTLVMQALAVYLTYGLQCYVPISLFLKQYAIPAIKYGTCKGTLYLWALIVPFAVTLVSCALPMLMSRLRERIAVLGLTSNFVLTLLLPLVLQTLLLKQETRLMFGRNWTVIRNVCFIILTSVLVVSCLIIELWVTPKRF